MYYVLETVQAIPMFGYDSITVSCAWELISVSMCYSQRDEFNTSLSRLCTVPTSHYLSCLTVLLACSVYCVGCSCRWHGHVLSGTTVTEIMCTPAIPAGINRPPPCRPSRIYPECRAYETRLALKDYFLGPGTPRESVFCIIWRIRWRGRAKD